jgi:hypothetical protein
VEANRQRNRAEDDSARAQSDSAAAQAQRARAEWDTAAAQSDCAAAQADRNRAQADAATSQVGFAEAQARSAKAQADADKAHADMTANQAASAAQIDAANSAADQSRAGELRAQQNEHQALADKATLRAQLEEPLNQILQTRDSARGLIVSMSDVLFDSGKYSLNPGAPRSSPRWPESCCPIRASTLLSGDTPITSAATT